MENNIIGNIFRIIRSVGLFLGIVVGIITGVVFALGTIFNNIITLYVILAFAFIVLILFITSLLSTDNANNESCIRRKLLRKNAAFILTGIVGTITVIIAILVLTVTTTGLINILFGILGFFFTLLITSIILLVYSLLLI